MKNDTQYTNAIAVIRYMAAAYRSKNYGSCLAAYFNKHSTIQKSPARNVRSAARKLVELCYSRLDEEFLVRHVPARFLDFDASLHPSPQTLDRVLNLPRPESSDEDGEPTKDFRGGVILHGSKHAGTTSAAFAMLSRWVRRGDSCRFQHISIHELVNVLRRLETEAGFERFLGSSEDTLFIDDLAGTNLRSESATILFDFVTEIVRRKYVVVVTVDLAGDDLARHWSALDPSIFSICRDIVVRLRNYSVVIDFGAERKAVHQVPKIESNTTTQTSPVETI